MIFSICYKTPILKRRKSENEGSATGHTRNMWCLFMSFLWTHFKTELPFLPSLCNTFASPSVPQIFSRGRGPCSSGCTSCWRAPQRASGPWRRRWRTGWWGRSRGPRWRPRCCSRPCPNARWRSYDTSATTNKLFQKSLTVFTNKCKVLRKQSGFFGRVVKKEVAKFRTWRDGTGLRSMSLASWIEKEI